MKLKKLRKGMQTDELRRKMTQKYPKKMKKSMMMRGKEKMPMMSRKWMKNLMMKTKNSKLSLSEIDLC
jgi:hypothetical protein